MKRIHLTCGDVYLVGYENCDVQGDVLENFYIADQLFTNPNETTLDKYFVRPFIKDSDQRQRGQYIIDTKMNILEKWPWTNNSIDEIIQINSLEHFWHNTEIPFIISEAYRVLKKGGKWGFDFPDIKNIVLKYHDSDPDFCMKLIYGSRKNEYCCHEFGYTVDSIRDYFTSDKWDLEFKDVVKHDYPATGVWATKK